MIELSLGADPELALVGRAGRAVRADRYLQGGVAGRIGVDGNGVPAEIRPGVSDSPIGLAAKCRHALVDMKAELANVLTREVTKVQAGSYVRNAVALGGHVHIGGAIVDHRESFLAWADLLAYKWGQKVEDPKATASRMSCGYGRPGDLRHQPHGLEYRSLGSWLCHPQVAVASISLVKIAAVLALQEHPPVSQDWPIQVHALREHDAIRRAAHFGPSIPDDCQVGLDLAVKLYAGGPYRFSGDVFKAWGI